MMADGAFTSVWSHQQNTMFFCKMVVIVDFNDYLCH